MFEQVKAALAKQLRISEDKIEPSSKIKDDLGADSLDVLELLMDLEENFGITIPDEELGRFETVQDIVSFLEKVKK